MIRYIVEDAVKGHLEGNVEDKVEVIDKLIKISRKHLLTKGNI